MRTESPRPHEETLYDCNILVRQCWTMHPATLPDPVLDNASSHTAGPQKAEYCTMHPATPPDPTRQHYTTLVGDRPFATNPRSYCWQISSGCRTVYDHWTLQCSRNLKIPLGWGIRSEASLLKFLSTLHLILLWETLALSLCCDTSPYKWLSK